MKTIKDIRESFRTMLERGALADDGNLELINASFVADEDTIFGELNHDWCRRERRWYLTQSLNVADIPPPIPRIWKDVASAHGQVNSNYGWCIFSKDNGEQYVKAIDALKANRNSRQAVMIYNRPSMHEDSKRDGMHDFMCTYSVQLLIRNNMLHYIVYMRSNDAVYGYKGDRHWHDFVHDMTLSNLLGTYQNIEKGLMFWNAGSLHVYPRHFHLVS